MDEFKSLSKFYSKKKDSDKKSKKYNFLYHTATKILICLIIFIVTLIVLKWKPDLKDKVYNVVYDNHFSFAYINNLYNKYFGSILPFDKILPDEEAVFNEKLVYSDVSLYKDGAVLTVDKNYLVPVLESGIVVFIGDKENYGKTIIIQQIDGIDTWYSNVNIGDIGMYDYVQKGSLLGEVEDSTLYLVFQKEGKYLDYKDYI